MVWILDDLPPLVGESDEANRLSCSDDDEADDAGDDWNEMDQENEPVQCLFCESVADSVEAAILHLANVHAFHLNALKEKFNMDQYSYIKVSWCVNCVGMIFNKLCFIVADDKLYQNS